MPHSTDHRSRELHCAPKARQPLVGVERTGPYAGEAHALPTELRRQVVPCTEGAYVTNRRVGCTTSVTSVCANNLSNRKPGHTTGGSARGGARWDGGPGRDGQHRTPTGRFAQEKTALLTLQTIPGHALHDKGLQKQKKASVY